MCVYSTKSEPILNETDGTLPACAEASAGRRTPNRTLGRAPHSNPSLTLGMLRGKKIFVYPVRETKFLLRGPPSLSAATEFRANKVGAPLKIKVNRFCCFPTNFFLFIQQSAPLYNCKTFLSGVIMFGCSRMICDSSGLK